MSPRVLATSIVILVSLAAVACTSGGSEGPPSTATSGAPPEASTSSSPGTEVQEPAPVELIQGDACGEAYFWAATASGDVAVTVSVDSRERSTDGPTTIKIDLPDPAVTVRVLRGDEMAANFCNDAIDIRSLPTSEQGATSGTGEIQLDPQAASGKLICGSTRGTLRLIGLESADGTRFAPIEVDSQGIGCYAG